MKYIPYLILALICFCSSVLAGQGMYPVPMVYVSGTPPAGNQFLSDDFTSYENVSGHLGGVSGSPWSTLTGSDSSVSIINDEFIFPSSTNVTLYTYDGQLDDQNQWACFEITNVSNFLGFYFRSTGDAADTAYAVRNESTGWQVRDCEGTSCTDWGGTSTDIIATASDNNFYCAAISGSGTNVVVEMWVSATEFATPTAGTDPELTWGTPDGTNSQDPVEVDDGGLYVGLYQGSTTGGKITNWKAGSW